MMHNPNAGRPENRPVGAITFRTGAAFAPELTPAQVGALSTLALAHIGDAVYELMMRTALCEAGLTAVTDLHRETVRRVNAPAQAKAVGKLLPALTDAERAVYKRGRNAKVNSVPQHADVSEYHAATGLETLFGWLYLQGQTQRLCELFAMLSEVL